MPPLTWIDAQLTALRSQDLLRDLAAPLARQGPVVEIAGRPIVNFASNDYLGLAADSRLAAAAATACQTHGLGQASSPLICGRSTLHEQLENRLAQFEGTEAALLFPSGYAANMGTIPALADEGDAIFADAKNHASLIDGCRLSRAERFIYPHNNAAALDALLKQNKNYRRRLIVTDTLFSMDGDLAPLADIAEAAHRHHAMLLVDEAHATGVFGPRGRGVAEHLGVEDGVHIKIGTLSKALGAAGGFVAGPRPLIHWLANRARSYVFSTAQPAPIAAAALTALDIVKHEPERRENLLTAAANLRDQLKAQGFNTGASATQIIPIITGSPSAALELSAALREQGFWLPPIRPPSVPPGESLLRLTLTAVHTTNMTASLLQALASQRR
jgi:8-amino-7-oxononanoate synthase